MRVSTVIFGALAIFVLLFINQESVNAQLLGNPQTNGLLPLPTPVLDAKDDTTQTNEDTSKVINVMSNDVYIGLVVNPSVSSVTQPSHGQAIKNGNSITYVPDANFFGSDSFRYTLSNGLLSDTATVFVTINSVNDLPQAANDFATINEDTIATVSVLSNDSDTADGDALAINSATQGSNGSTSIAGNTVRYTPNVNFNGADNFNYTIQDGRGGTVSATVFVTINAVNDNPIAVEDSIITDEDNSVAISVLGNDSDPDGNSLVINSVTQGSNGQAMINSDHTITYTPNADFNGMDSISYTISDGNGGQDTSSVTITINPVADLTITKTQSGLVSSDPLNNETQTREELEA
ncbi:MAG: tandem-95 repeat protein, partial [Thaumarchaeota archaeon]|nr:tandem-95 repeat protein [Nitrososphaerota archaeon]